jgi:endonuclease VIII
MPEGPSIIILKEAVQAFKGKKILEVNGNSKIDKERMKNKKIMDFKSWGKHFLICFNDFTLRIHFMLFGSYRINEIKNAIPRLQFRFRKGDLSFYACSVKYIEGDLDDEYDWSADIMNQNWDAIAARKKLKALPEILVCDALLNQTIFAGVGNIIKNEVLFRIKLHPESKIGKLKGRKLTQLISETRAYCFDFLKWKKAFELKKHWLAYSRKICPSCEIPLMKKWLGETHRRTFFCNNCQELYR